MNRTLSAVLFAAMAAAMHPCLAHEPPVVAHGRAGEAVGSERVEGISARSGAMSFWRQLAFAPRPGRAGGPLGWIDAPSGAHSKRPVVVQRYSRANVAAMVAC
jgi:hypothetical protein